MIKVMDVGCFNAMKIKCSTVVLILLLSFQVSGQNQNTVQADQNRPQGQNQGATTKADQGWPRSIDEDSLKKFEPVPAYQLSDSTRQTVIKSSIDPLWPLWQQRSYGFGLKPDRTSIPVVIDAPLQVNSFLQLRTNARSQRRWGCHFMEAYSIFDNISRFTMLIDKHIELDRPVAELYYFGNKYNTSEEGYNWVRIGSDVRGHSYLFSRDRAVFTDPWS